MYENKSIIAVIPARGGSRRLPRKNLAPLCGTPLTEWTITAARSSKFIDKIVLSSEDAEILSLARTLGCESVARPAPLATDEASSVETVLHAIDQVPDFDWVVLLQPTSPLRQAADIDGCIDLFATNKFHSCVSVCELKGRPSWLFRRDARSTLCPVFDKSTSLGSSNEPLMMVNGAVYVTEIEWLRQKKKFTTESTGGYLMPLSRSLDIDSKTDLELAEFWMKASQTGC